MTLVKDGVFIKTIITFSRSVTVREDVTRRCSCLALVSASARGGVREDRKCVGSIHTYIHPILSLLLAMCAGNTQLYLYKYVCVSVFVKSSGPNP